MKLHFFHIKKKFSPHKDAHVFKLGPSATIYMPVDRNFGQRCHTFLKKNHKNGQL